MKPVLVAGISLVLLLLTIQRTRNFAHPLFLLIGALAFSGPLAGVLEVEKVVKYEWEIVIMAMIFYTSFLLIPLVSNLPPTNESLAILRHSIAGRFSNIGFWIGLSGFLVIGEFLRQLWMVDFSLELWWKHSLGPRFGRPWGRGRLGGSNFVVTLWVSIYGIAGPLIGFLVPFARRSQLGFAVVVFALQLFMAFSSGSRTPFVIVAGTYFAACFLIEGFRFRPLTVSALALFIASAFLANVMVGSRTIGLNESDDIFRNVSFVPKTDDNLPRFMSIISLDEQGATHPPTIPFLQSAFLGVVPRYFWPTKPTLSQDYWGKWRLYFTTVSLGGEIVCLFGFYPGLLIAICTGGAVYKLLCWHYVRAGSIIDWGIYLYIAFITYMLFRSIGNFSLYLTPVVFMHLTRIVTQKIRIKRASE